MNKWIRSSWSPYVVGVLIGMLSWLVFWKEIGKPLGVSTSMSAWSGAACSVVVGQEVVANNTYWKQKSHQAAWNYGTLFIFGAAGGAFLSALLSGQFKPEVVPAVWRERFGGSVLLRMLGAVGGGILIMYGARLAGGCTSGHGISGGLQLALSSWTFFVVMFVSGVVTAALVFGLGRGKTA